MDDGVSLQDLLDEGHQWLFRGLFLPPFDNWMRYEDEISPPRPDLIGWNCRRHHANGLTESAYTSWSTDRETAYMFADEARIGTPSQGDVVVFRVRIDTLANRAYYGRADEDEILLEGTVEGIEVSTGLEAEEEDA